MCQVGSASSRASASGGYVKPIAQVRPALD